MRKAVIILLAILVIASAATGCASPGKIVTGSKDPTRFKEEYEALNSELNEDGTNKHSLISIDKKNNIVYLTYDELMDFLGSKSGLLYFGRPGCPWCRSLVPHMLQYANEDNVYIYYYDIENDRAENNDNYKSILAILGNYLPTDTVTQDEDDPDFDPGLKRVVLPQLFFIKDGKVKDEWYLYQHELLKNNETDKVKQSLRDKYALVT